MSGEILVLDDDAQFCNSIARALKAEGLSVVSAHRGAFASQLVEEIDPALVVVDGLLPDTNGISWIEALRESGDERAIVFVSAFYRDLETFRRLTRELAVSRVFHKPLAIDRFAREVALLVSPLGALPEPRLRLVTPRMDDNVIYPDELDARRREKDANRQRASLPDNVLALSRAIVRMQDDRDRTSLVDDALRTVDRLQQSASVQGREEIAETVAAVEAQLRSLKSAGTTDWGRIRESVEALEKEVSEEVTRTTAASAPVVTPAAARLLTDVFPESLVPTMLIIEDDPAMVAYLRAVFEELLLHVQVASSVSDALVAAAESPPSTVLIGWPLQDDKAAEQFLSGFRTIRGHEQCKVIMLSVQDDMALRRRAASWGVDVFISQPIDLSRLRYAVELSLQAPACARPSILVVGDESAADQLSRAGFEVRHEAGAESAIEALHVQRASVVLLGKSVDDASIAPVLRMSAWDIDFCIAAFASSTGSGSNAVDEVLSPDGGWMAALHRMAEVVDERRGRSLRCSGTGLVQRVGGLASVEAGLAYAQRHGHTYGIALFRAIGLGDLDPAIEYAITGRLGRSLLARFRREDVRARWDAETFLVGMEGPDTGALSDVVGRFQSEIKTQLANDGLAPDGFHFAAGLATCPLDGDTVRTLVLNAYQRLQGATS